MAYRRAGDETGDMSKDTLFRKEESSKPPQRVGICASCEWFKEKPLSRWQFAVFLLFGILTPIWLIMKATSGVSGDVLGGVMAIILACYGANHFRILLGLKEEVDKFGKNNRHFKRTNAGLRMEVSKLTKASEELTAVSHRLSQTTKSYQDNIKKFQALDEKLSKFSGDSIEGIEKIKEMSKSVQDSITKEMVQHERDILWKVQEAMELKDDQDGLNEDEFNNFIHALPLNFQHRFKNMGKTFNDISGDDDILDMDEFKILCDKFAEDEVKCKCGLNEPHDHDHDHDDHD